MRSLPALVLGVALAAVAWWCAVEAPSDLASALPGVQADYEDTRTLPSAQRALHATRQQTLWLDRWALLAAALALGAFSQAFRFGKRPATWRGALAAAAIGLVLHAGWHSLSEQSRLLNEGRWSVGDDSLPLYAGALAPRLAEWQSRVGPHDAVLLAGRQDLLLNVVASALHSRPIYPLLHPLPAQASAEQLRELAQQVAVGRDAPKRWLVDLDALAAPAGTLFGHPLLLELEP